MDGLGSAAGEGPILTQEAIGRQQPEIGVPRELFVLVHKVQLVVRVGQLVALAVALGRGHGRRREGIGGEGGREERRASAPALAGWGDGGREGWPRRARARLIYAASADGRRRPTGQKEDGSVSCPAPAKAPPTRARPFFRARDKAAIRRGRRRRRPLRLACQRSVRSEGKRRRGKKAEDKAAAVTFSEPRLARHGNAIRRLDLEVL